MNQPINELYAFIAEDATGEGVCAFQMPSGNWMPMVGADMDRVSDLKSAAQKIATRSGKRILICKFSIRTQIGVIEPGEQ